MTDAKREQLLRTAETAFLIKGLVDHCQAKDIQFKELTEDDIIDVCAKSAAAGSLTELLG